MNTLVQFFSLPLTTATCKCNYVKTFFLVINYNKTCCVLFFRSCMTSSYEGGAVTLSDILSGSRRSSFLENSKTLVQGKIYHHKHKIQACSEDFF